LQIRPTPRTFYAAHPRRTDPRAFPLNRDSPGPQRHLLLQRLRGQQGHARTRWRRHTHPGDLAFLHTHGVWDDPSAIDHNTDLFAKALLDELLPRVESEYRVSKDRNDRAITGLSMGGLESLEVGLTHAGQFGWIAGFSSAVHNLDYTNVLASLDPKTANLHLLWIACGTETISSNPIAS